MNDEKLAYILRFSSPFEIYVVGADRKLKLIKCPFRVLVLENIGSLEKGHVHLVAMVKTTNDLITVFIITGSAYYYYHFDIL